MSEASTTTTNNGPMIAAVLTAIGASLCCIGPLVLLVLGISGAWISYLTALEPYRPIFIGITLIFLGLAFRKLYLVPQQCAIAVKSEYASKTASVTYDPDKASLSDFTQATANAGYPSTIRRR